MSREALYVLQQCLNAVQVSSFYALLAVAYVLLYGIANRINLAFGAVAMWAGYLTIGAIAVLAAMTPLVIAAILLLAVASALAGTVALGYVVHHSMIRPLIGRSSLAMLIATIGLALVLEEIIRITHQSRELWLAPIFNERIVLAAANGFSVEITWMRLVIVGASLALSVGLVIFVAKHAFGRRWRACAQDLKMAALCGVDVESTLTWTMIISSAYAAAAGAVIALYYGNVTFFMGTVLGLKALLVAVIGGLTSVPGALVGGFLLGFLESFWSAYFAANYRDVVVFGLLILMLIFRPQGLFAATGGSDQDEI